jgi:hypothetical protein
MPAGRASKKPGSFSIALSSLSMLLIRPEQSWRGFQLGPQAMPSYSCIMQRNDSCGIISHCLPVNRQNSPSQWGTEP